MARSVMSLSGASLIKAAERIGISADELRRAEQPSRLRHTFTVKGSSLTHLGEEEVLALQQTYGASLHLEIRLGELTELSVDETTSTTDLQAFHARVVQGNDYEIVIDLQKDDLLAREIALPAGWQAYWFLFAATLEESLRRGIQHFESQIWTADDCRLLLLIDDRDFRASGPYLHVLGAGQHEDLVDVLAEPAPDWSTIIHIRDTRDRYISWESTWVKHLTPLQFDLDISVGADTPLGELLAAQAVKMAVLFTCDRARVRPRAGQTAEIRAEFRGQQYSTVVPIDEEAPLADASRTSLSAMTQLVIWCYRRETGELERDWTENRLPFVQTRVAETLGAVEENNRLQSLMRFVPFLLEGLDWHWKAFIEDRVAEYLGKVRQLEEVVARTVTAFTQQTASLTKGLSDVVLAAVGVLVGSFIAAAFADPFNAALFRVAVLVYGAYALLVPGLLGLSSQRGHFNAQRVEFKHQTEQFRRVMHTDRVDEIVANRVQVAVERFGFWFRVAIVGYLILAVAAIAAAAFVPGVIQS